MATAATGEVGQLLREWRERRRLTQLELAPHFLGRLSQQIAITGDQELAALMEEIAGYPPDGTEGVSAAPAEASDVLGPVRFRAPDGGEWSFFGMFAAFDTPFEVTTSELALELLFPADLPTAEAFKRGAP
jgi:hypothetical protein